MRIAGHIFTLVFVLSASASFACMCVGMPQTEDEVVKSAEASDIVFVGTIREAVRREWIEGDEAGVEWKARVYVEEAFRGVDVGSEVELWTIPSSCAIAFRAGDSYLFFARKSPDDGRPHVGQCNSYRYTPRAKGDPVPNDPNRGVVMQVVWTLRSAYP